ncbi:hypothetical protein N7470_002290 [Penicillium chermesinum]|nr:hypothetical protein N7470_002290 [Penicillium chermesinum]
MSLSGKVILITGSSQGIGKAVALHLASKGASIVINYNSNSAEADKVVNEIGSDRAIAIQADAGNLADLDRLVDTTVARFGKIDVVVPNAGILPMRDLESTSEEDFDKTYNLLVKGPYFLAQKAVKHMPAGGRVIFVSSSVLSTSSIGPAYLLYGSAKGAIEGMTRIMSKDLARKGILSEQVLKTVAGFSPFNRIGEPSEIASVLGFLAGEDSKWMSGQIVRVNGAMA